MSLIGGILGGIGSIFGQRAEHKQQRRNIQDQLNADRELAKYAYGKDLEMWNRQNEYNMPAAQMGRLKDAGLNPHLVYGTGTVTGNTSGQMPKYQNVKSDFSRRQAPLNAMAMLGMYQDFKMKNAQIGTQEAEEHIKQAYAHWLSENTGELEAVNKGLGKGKVIARKRPQSSVLFDTQLQAKQAQIRMLEQSTRRAASEANLREIREEFERWMQSFGLAGKGVNIMRTLFGGK